MFKIKTRGIIGRTLDNIFTKSVTFEIRVPEGNWSPYFGHYQNQKWGQWDSNSCWCLSAVNCAEDQLEWMWKNNKFSKEAKDFFTKYGYIDSDNDFSLSERFLEILGGVGDVGNNQMEAWILMQTYGCIPRDMLSYTKERADLFVNKSQFNADYFLKSEVTDEMLNIGKMFLTFINIDRQWIGTLWQTPSIDILKKCLQQAPLQIGIPIPAFTQNWNSTFVKYDGKKIAEHAIELYFINEKNEYDIFDQYLPNLKTLSSDYYIPLVSQGILTAKIIPVPVIPTPIQVPWYIKMIDIIINWFNNLYGLKSVKYSWG